jgi:cell division septation protein DedD
MAVALVLAVAPSRRLSAQSDPRLVGAVQLAQQGEGDSARRAVTTILNATPVSDPLYAEALYTLGKIAPTTAEMQKNMLRVAVEYASSPWADNALLQLAQLSYASGDLAAAERNLERLRSDYPASDVLAQASLWAARSYFTQGNSAAGCDWLKTGLGAVGSDVELQNQLQFLNGRCAALADTGARRDTTKADTTRAAPAAPAQPAPAKPTPPAPAATPAPATPAKPAPAPAAAPVWTVQVAALKTDAQATSVAEMLAKDGFKPHVVTDPDGTRKVRAGKFATRAEADAYARRLRQKYGPVFVVQETP